MKYIDTHAHYNDSVYDSNLEEILEKVKKANVTHVVNVGYNEQSSIKGIKLCEKYDWMYTAIGVHPHDVDSFCLEHIKQLYQENLDKKIVAIGEIGLDYAYTKENREKQIAMFVDQIDFAQTIQLPIIVHTRDASLDTYQILKEKVHPDTKVLIHCFSPTDDLVRLVLERKYMVAFGGNITYPRNESFQKYIEQIPLNQLLLETDCPYLAPVPFRGKVNDSSYLYIINEKLAQYKGISQEQMADITTENAIQFFNLK